MFKNYFLLISMFLLVIVSCSQKHTIVKNESIGLIFKAEVGDWHSEDGFNYLSIKTILLNNSLDTVKYVNMYCDSDIIYAIETKRLNIHFRECNKNFPENHILLPYQNVQSVLEARTQEDINMLKGVRFRVGLTI